jgi:hypothetical protein
MRRAAELAVYLAFVIALVASSTPRRVGDGLEYIATALNLSAGRPPALSAADRAAIAPEVARWDGAPPVSALVWPELVGVDGRQDTPHVWIYSLLVVPWLWATGLLSLHPNHAFTIVNLLCLGAAWVALRAHASLWITLLLCASPILWWVDKAHTETVLFSLLVVALCWARRGRAGAMALAGVAAAQNPGLLVAWPVVFAELLRFRRATEPWRALWRMSAAGLGTVAIVALYNWSRHGRLSPLAAWTAARVPSLREWLAPVTDLNIGLFATAPVFVLALVAYASQARHESAATREGRSTAAPAWSWVISAVGITAVLTVVAQSTNINHGGTPGLSRYALWLLPLMLPVLLHLSPDTRGLADADSPDGLERRTERTPTRREPWLLRALCVASVLTSIAAFRPSLPEVYRYPSPVATWAWTSWPTLDHPAAEVFAERVSHTEPATLPTSAHGCAKVLLFEGSWPVPCLPRGSLPESCRRPGTLCYASLSSSGTSVTPTTPALFPHVISDRRWSDVDAFMPALQRAFAEISGHELQRTGVGDPGSAVRALAGAPWAWTVQSDRALLVFVPSAHAGASVTLRTAAGLRGTLRNLSRDRVERDLGAPDGTGEAWRVDLPTSDDAFAIVLRASPAVAGQTR